MALQSCIRWIFDVFCHTFVGIKMNYLSVLYIMAVTRSNSNSVLRRRRRASKRRKGGTIKNTVRRNVGGKRSTKRGFSHGIKTTEGESIFEAYLSVLTRLLGTQEIYQNIVKSYSDTVTIQNVKGKDDHPKPEKKSVEPIIYYYDDLNEQGTHYRVFSYEINTTSRKKSVVKKWTIIDPYDLYQKKNSHGFCQMFAFFIATKNTRGFINKTETPRQNMKDVHIHNTFECLKKTIHLMETFPDEIIDSLELEFKDLKKEPNYGISRNMKLAHLIRDLREFETADVDSYITDLDKSKPASEED